jgi:hypothetical protein
VGGANYIHTVLYHMLFVYKLHNVRSCYEQVLQYEHVGTIVCVKFKESHLVLFASRGLDCT